MTPFGDEARFLVDLWGRLSNPSETLEMLADQGRSGPPGRAGAAVSVVGRPVSGTAAGSPKQKGRLSNPVQHRLSAREIEQLIHRYREGASVDRLARDHEIHRTTVIHHLHRARIARRRVVRKMTDESVAQAAARYDQGASLALVASEFGVHERTLAREFRRAGVPIRPRRGWGR